jgi:hypothetical protein
MDPTRKAFVEAVMVRNVAARFAADTTGMEHATPEAREKYLKSHPKADKSKHTVKKNDGGEKSNPVNKYVDDLKAKKKKEDEKEKGESPKSEGPSLKEEVQKHYEEFAKDLEDAPDAETAKSKLQTAKHFAEHGKTYGYDDKQIDRFKKIQEKLEKTVKGDSKD